MTQPRYQVFVSSTFRDLREERQSVLDAILEMSHFPAGMEMFPASDSTPWAIIERVIRDSDFYILIIGGMYGSTDADGISYTEREYDYAVSMEKPVLAFLHRSPATIPQGKSEMNVRARNQLKKFRKKVESHHCKYWTTIDELKYLVVISLTSAISESPAVGWVRADGIDNQDLLKRLAELQERFDHLSNENERLRDQVDMLSLNSLEGIAEGDDEILVNFEYHTDRSKKVSHSFALTWNEIFFGLANDLTIPVVESVVLRKLGVLIRDSPLLNLPQLDRPKLSVVVATESFSAIKIQLLALDLIEVTTVLRSLQTWGRNVQRIPEPRETAAWKLTKKGLRHLLSKEAIRS